MRKRYAALSPQHLVERPDREEATGTPAVDSTRDGTSIIVIRVSSIILIALNGIAAHAMVDGVEGGH